MSGYGSPDDHAQALSAGFECLLTKPLNWELLEKIMQGPER